MCTSRSTKTRDQSGSSSDSDQESVFSSSSQLDSISVHASQIDSTRNNSDIRHPPEESLNSKSDQRRIWQLENRVKLLKLENEAILCQLGEMKFSQERKEREERSSKNFNQIFQQDFKSFLGNGNPRIDNDGVCLKDHRGFFSESNEMNYNSFTSNSSSGGFLKPQSVKNGQNIGMRITSGLQKEVKASGNESGAGRTTNPLTPTFRDETGNKSSVRQSSEDVSFSVQQDDSNEHISLSCKPSISVAATLNNNYKLLLLTVAQSLLSSDVIELKSWAREKFSIENAQNATNVLFQLDEKGAINAEDLSQLYDFLGSIIRYDLVYIIDAFLLGDYSLLRRIPRSKNRDSGGGRNSRLGRISGFGDHFTAASSNSTASAERVRNPTKSGKPQNNNELPSSVAHQIQQAASSSFSVPQNTSNPGKLFSRAPNENQSAARVQLQPLSKVNEMVVVNGSTALSKYSLKF